MLVADSERARFIITFRAPEGTWVSANALGNTPGQITTSLEEIYPKQRFTAYCIFGD